jgi:hypothetical protein
VRLNISTFNRSSPEPQVPEVQRNLLSCGDIYTDICNEDVGTSGIS